jgi:hypothetical protein
LLYPNNGGSSSNERGLFLYDGALYPKEGGPYPKDGVTWLNDGGLYPGDREERREMGEGGSQN